MTTPKVFVIGMDGKPLLPTDPAPARKLLDSGKAEVFQVVPFTIRLKRVVENPVGDFTIGIDDGAKKVGVAVVNEQTQTVVFTGTIELRQDVSRKMQQRLSYRRSRRARKTRYRAARFLNRARRRGATGCGTTGWLPPTIRQKKESIVRVVSDLQRVLSITRAVVEQGMFDTSTLSAGRPLAGVEYQTPCYTGQDFREKVLWRDHYRCQRCAGQEQLQAHHILPKAQGGSDTPANGITLCQACHAALHAGLWVLAKVPKTFHYPAHLQQGKRYLAKHLEQLNLIVELCLGFQTRTWRQQVGLEKSHIHDAIAMVARTYTPDQRAKAYRILPKRKKVWEDNPTKQQVEKNGFCHWDLVKAQHRTRGSVIGSIRSLKANALTLRTAWDDNFPVAYRKTRLLWRFRAILYI